MAITVGSVEVDVIPNARGIYQRLREAVVPAADRVGDEVGRVIGRQVMSGVAQGVVDGVTRGGRLAQAPAARQGEQTGSAFSRSFKARLEAALRTLPEIRLNANSTDVDRELANIRAQMAALRDVRIGIDISSAEATAIIDRLQERLRRLSTESPDVAVRVDTGAAAAQLAAFQAEVDRLDGRSVDVDVDTRAATANLNLLTTAALAFGPAILPVLPVVAAGLGSIAAAGAAAAAGVGSIALVAVPAFKQIGTVLQAQKAAQDAAASSTARGAQAAAQASSKALQQASAQQALATAERNGARQIAQAQQQVVQARQAAAQAAQQAAQQNEQAARRVQDAERSLADAQVAARKAQQDLTVARQQAAQELEDLNNRLTDAQLSQRDAEIQLKEATAQRDAVLKNANSTELDKQKALLVYDQAVQRLKEQTTETKRLKEQTEAANKAGVKGSDTYLAAQDRLAQAQRNVTDQQQAVKDAQTEAARVQLQTAQQVAQAQQRVSEATANVAVAQQNAADAVASAQRQIASASLSAAGGVDQAALAQSKYREELAKLTPSARGTYNAFLDLRTAFGEWSKSLQPAVMPIFTRALIGIRNALPTLTPFVKDAADAIRDLQDRASEGFKSPWWQTFKQDLQVSVKPAIEGLGIAFGNTFKGIVLVIDAFLPHMDGISLRLQRITKRFADWAAGLKGSPEFERFLSFSSDKAPLLADALKKIGGGFLSVSEALAPLSGPLLKLIGGMAEAIWIIADKAPWLILLIYGIITAVKLWTIAQAAFNLVMSANPLVLLGLALVALVGVVIYAYNKFGWFRTAVQWVWDGIKAAASAVVDWFKGPFVNFFTKTIPGVFRTVLNWVKRNWPWILGALTGPIGLAVVAIIKHWDGIKSAFSRAWAWIKSNVLYPIRDFFTKTIPGWGGTLRDRMVGAFDAARKGIKTAWDKIKDIAKKPVQFIVDTVYNNGIRKVWNLVTDAFGGKHLEPMKFATGGVLPGYTPGRDVHLAALSGGEAIMRPEWTRAVGAGYVHAMNAAARSGGVTGVQRALGIPGFKDGGIFSGIGNTLSGAWDKIKKGASWLKDTFSGAVQAGVKHVVNPLIDRIPGGNIGFVHLLKDLMKGAVTKLVGAGKKGDDLATPNIKYTPTKGVEQWRPVVLQALREVGQPASLAASTLRRMQQESGGNPTIVNKWDSNWQAGHPSVGLMQVIGPTFQHYAGKYRGKGPFLYNVSVDPLANIYSSMRYALGAYGSLSKAYDRPGGYDSGGWMPPGMNLMYNGLGQPEAVLTPSQWRAIQGAAARGADGSNVGDLQVQVFVGDREITDIARTEVRRSNGELLAALNARPRR